MVIRFPQHKFSQHGFPILRVTKHADLFILRDGQTYISVKMTSK